MAVATTYTLTAPTPASGNVDAPSGNFTASIGAGNTLASPVTVTPAASTSAGTFTPTTVSLSTGTPTVTFTYTPIDPGPITITTTNGGGLTDPAGVVYTCIATATTAFSVLKNPTGVTRHYSYLGTRGITLAAGARYSFPGSVYQLNRHGWNYRDFNDFTRNLIAGTIEIVSTPGVIVKDTTSGNVKVLGDTGGAITFGDPSWGEAPG